MNHAQLCKLSTENKGLVESIPSLGDIGWVHARRKLYTGPGPAQTRSGDSGVIYELARDSRTHGHGRFGVFCLEEKIETQRLATPYV